MAEETASIQPVVPPAPDAVPEVAAGTPPGGDASAVGGPATPAPTPAQAVAEQAKPYIAAAGTAAQKAAELAQPAPPPAPVPHARLLAMISGLATGLGAAATSLATHGKEGGAVEVTQVRGEEQKQRIEKQQAAGAQRNQQLQQQIQVFDTNHKMAQNIMLMATMPNDLTKSDLAVQSGKLDVTGKAQDIRTKALQDFMQTGDMGAYNDTLSKVGAVTGAPGAPAGPAGAIPPVAIATWKNSVDAATSAYPKDTAIQQAATVLADPKSTPQQQAMAAATAKNRMTSLDAGAASRDKQAAAATAAIGAAEKQTALDAYNEYKGSGGTASFDVWDATRKSYEEATAKLKAQREYQQEDIDTVAKALIQPGNLTSLKDVASMRNDERLRIFAAAQKLDPNFSPTIAGQRIKFLGEYEDPRGRSSINRQAVNNIVQHAADLSDVNKQYSRTDERFLNTPLNEIKKQFGNETYTKYALTNGVLKDELSLYFAGGYAPTGDQAKLWDKIQSDSATPGQTEAFARDIVHLATRRASTFNSGFKTNMGFDDPNMITPDAKTAAERLGVGDDFAQFSSGGIIQQNPSSPVSKAPAASAASKVHANLTDFTHHFASQKGMIYSDDGKTWYDSKGALVGK